MKKLLVIVLCFITGIAGILGAQEESDSGMTSSRTLDVQISSLPELKVIFKQNFKFPAMQGDGMLTKGNNFKVSVGGEITPISFNALADAVLTPIAFLELSVGGRIGSGWVIPIGKGIGLNISDGNTPQKMKYDGKPFDGALYGAYIGGLLQMDFGLLMPWDYDHVVFQSYHEINYAGYSRGTNEKPWFYESDAGENVNGFNYYGNFLLGYQIPDFWFNTIAVLTEMDYHLYNLPNRDVYGDDLIRWHIAGVLGFTFTDWLDVKLITQFRTLRNYKDGSPEWKGSTISGNPNGYYYRDRILDTSNKMDFHFYRVAALVTFKLP